MLVTVQYSYPRIVHGKYLPCLLNVQCNVKENQIRAVLLLVVIFEEQFECLRYNSGILLPSLLQVFLEFFHAQ